MSSNNQRQKAKKSRNDEIKAQIAYFLSKKGYNKSEFAKILGISPASFYNKLNNPDSFKLDEFNLLLEFLDLDPATKLKLIA